MAHKILVSPRFNPSLGDTTLGEFFFNQADKFSDNICQIDGRIDKSETYKSVKQRTVRMAISLQEKKITNKDVVIVCSLNTLDNSIPVIASFYLGAKVLNLDPSLSPRVIKHFITLVEPTIIFCQEDDVTTISNCLEDVNIKTEIIVFGNNPKYTSFTKLTQRKSNEDLFKPAKVDVNEIAAFFCSSGTTGLPKAVCYNHVNLLAIIELMLKDFEPTFGCALHFSTFYWISGLGTLFHTFLRGGTRVFDQRMDGVNTFKMIEKYKVTNTFLAPILTYHLTDVQNPEKYDCSSFRFLVVGGTSINNMQLTQLAKLFPHADILFGYGLTECGTAAIFSPQEDQALIKGKIGSCGKIPYDTHLKIVDPDTEEILGPNQKGEIRLKRKYFMQGYFKIDSSNFFDIDGYFKTGDIGFYDEDECLYICGRLKETFKYLSWHIVPSVIESALMEHPDVKDAVVFGIPRAKEGDVPAACVMLHDKCNPDKNDIIKFVEERVSDREKLRGGIKIFKDFPRTPTGKVIRSELKNIFMETL